MHTLVGKHLHKTVEAPIIVHHAVADLSLPPLFRSLLLFLLNNHLPLGKIANHHSSFSQSVRDEMRSFMQTVLLLAPLLLRDSLINFGEMDVAAGFLLTFVAFGTDFVELLIIPTIALEAADVVETAFVS